MITNSDRMALPLPANPPDLPKRTGSDEKCSKKCSKNAAIRCPVGSYVVDFVGKFDIFNGGRGGIRTHGTVSRTPVFKTGSLNHSDTLPDDGH